MTAKGPTEASPTYAADTGASSAELKAQREAYLASMEALKKKVLPMGGFWWQLLGGGGQLMPNPKCLPKCNVPKPAEQ